MRTFINLQEEGETNNSGQTFVRYDGDLRDIAAKRDDMISHLRFPIPDGGITSVDRIRLLAVPECDLAQREREIAAGNVDTDSTATVIERIIATNPGVTIERIDECGAPWFEVEFEESDGIHYHSLTVLDDDSWETIQVDANFNMSARRIVASYFFVQAIGIAAWWVLLLAYPPSIKWFQPTDWPADSLSWKATSA